MAAPAANEAQPQGPQVPRAPQANVVQHILAEQPPQKPILDANGLEVICLPFFSYFASAAAAFHAHVSAYVIHCLVISFWCHMHFILVFPA